MESYVNESVFSQIYEFLFRIHQWPNFCLHNNAYGQCECTVMLCILYLKRILSVLQGAIQFALSWIVIVQLASYKYFTILTRFSTEIQYSSTIVYCTKFKCQTLFILNASEPAFHVVRVVFSCIFNLDSFVHVFGERRYVTQHLH